MSRKYHSQPERGTVEQRDEVFEIRMSVHEELREELEEMAENSEYSDWHYSKRTRHNTPVGELIYRDMVLPALDKEVEE